jgi:hypothetical protein
MWWQTTAQLSLRNRQQLESFPQHKSQGPVFEHKDPDLDAALVFHYAKTKITGKFKVMHTQNLLGILDDTPQTKFSRHSEDAASFASDWLSNLQGWDSGLCW